MIVLSIQPGQYPIGGFRIFIECAAEVADVRLSGRGDVYVNPDIPFVVSVDNSPDVDASSTTAYDRVDDRQFPENG